MSAISDLTPHMADYAGDFADSGNINWLPYVMYFHPFGYRSDTVSTDTSGFRYTEARDRRYSVADLGGVDAVRVIAGSSTVFGIGASRDRHTLAARLTENDPRPEAWVNFGGRSFNSTQELVLFTLNKHRLPKVEEIVLLSGFNDLGLARLPARMRGEHGAFFMCRDFFDAMSRKKPSTFTSWLRGRGEREEDEPPPSMAEQIDYAAGLTLRHLDVWRALAADMGATLTYVLQPLANWVRATGSREEEALFAELEQRGSFTQTYGDILAADTHRTYAQRLRAGAEGMGVRFVDLAPVIAAEAAPDRWLFVDRIHFTDDGHDFVAKLMLRTLTGG